MREVLFSENGSAISRPEISCEPCLPEISARPALSGPWTVRGTRTGAGDLSTSLEVTVGERLDVTGEEGFEVTVASNASIISLAPVRGRPRRVFSPVNVTDSGQSCAITGIIILVSRPDSPT